MRGRLLLRVALVLAALTPFATAAAGVCNPYKPYIVVANENIADQNQADVAAAADGTTC